MLWFSFIYCRMLLFVFINRYVFSFVLIIISAHLFLWHRKHSLSSIVSIINHFNNFYFSFLPDRSRAFPALVFAFLMSYIATGSLFNCLVWYIKHPVSSLTAWISARIQHIAPIGRTTNNLHVISGRDLSRQIILHHCFSLSGSDKISCTALIALLYLR